MNLDHKKHAVRGRAELGHFFAPWNLVTFVYLPLLLAYFLIDARFFRVFYNSAKTFTAESMLFFLVCVVGFGLFSLLGAKAAAVFDKTNNTPTDGATTCPTWLYWGLNLALLFSLAAYGIWMLIGVARAGGPMRFVSLYLSNPFYVKSSILQTLPGVTTLTQLAVAAVPLSLVFRASDHRFNRLLLVLVLCSALIRSVIYSERLALIELIVPLLYVAYAHIRVKKWQFLLVILAAVALLFGFFSAAELRRSYTYSTERPSVSSAAARFFGYYLTSINNGQTLYNHYLLVKPFSGSLQMLWKFPIGLVDYTSVFPEAKSLPEDWFVRNGLNEEFNTATLFGDIAIDFGWVGMVVVFALGYFAGLMHTLGQKHRFFCALYAVWLVGLLEAMRIYYFFNVRLFPAYVLFATIFLLLGFSKQNDRQKRFFQSGTA